MKKHLEMFAKIKDRFPSKEASFEFFKTFSSKKELGIVSVCDRNRKFDIRGENTPSCTAYPYLSFIDFGGEGKKKDVIHLLRENNPSLSFNQAVELLSEWLNEDTSNLKEKKFEKEDNKVKVAPYSDSYVRNQLKERAKPENKEIYTRLVKGLFRACSIEEMRVGCKAFDIGLNKYDVDGETQYRLFIPEYDANEVAWGSYRYNREYTNVKGLLRKNAERVLFGSHLLKFFNKNKPLIINEGHSDVCVNVSKYLQAVTSGSSTTPLKKYFNQLKGFELHFYPDADQPGIKGVTQKIIDLELYNSSVSVEEQIAYKVFFWGKGFIENSITEFNSLCLPIEEAKKVKKYEKQWWIKFIDLIKNEEMDLDILEKEQNDIIKKYKKENNIEFDLPNKILIKNWSFITSKIVKKGFDFIDFHMEFNESKNYDKFISKYKFK